MDHPFIFWGAIGALSIVLSGFLVREILTAHRHGRLKRGAVGLLRDFRATTPATVTPYHVFLMAAEAKTLDNLNIDYPRERVSVNGRKVALSLTADEFDSLIEQVLEHAQGLVGDAAREKKVYLSGDSLHIAVIAMKLQIVQREVAGITRTHEPAPLAPVNLASEEMNRVNSGM